MEGFLRVRLIILLLMCRGVSLTWRKFGCRRFSDDFKLSDHAVRSTGLRRVPFRPDRSWSPIRHRHRSMIMTMSSDQNVSTSVSVGLPLSAEVQREATLTSPQNRICVTRTRCPGRSGSPAETPLAGRLNPAPPHRRHRGRWTSAPAPARSGRRYRQSSAYAASVRLQADRAPSASPKSDPGASPRYDLHAAWPSPDAWALWRAIAGLQHNPFGSNRTAHAIIVFRAILRRTGSRFGGSRSNSRQMCRALF